MDKEKSEIRTLRADEIEVKVKQIGETGAVALLYKTARTDMAMLDEIYGAGNWQNDYKEIKGNLYCGIGIRFADGADYVWRWDCGIESRADDEGNEKKGEASDAFKRAGTRWGIGRELYTAPFIFLKVDTKPGGAANGKARYVLADKFARFDVKEIGYDANRRINRLVIIDEKDRIVFTYPKACADMKPLPEKKDGQVLKNKQSVKDVLIEALETEVILKGKQYKLGDLPQVTLEWYSEHSRNSDIKEKSRVILNHKYVEELNAGADEIPFDVND